MKWRKGNDKIPVGKERSKLHIKYKDVPDLLIFINEGWYWYEKSIEESRSFPVHEISWAAIEYLDESSTSVDADRETKRQPIEDALYATKRFLTTEATDLADGILDYLNDHGFTITASLHSSSVTGEEDEDDNLWNELIEDVEDGISQPSLQGKYKLYKK